ncbi:MAG: cell division protein FtsK [Dehalococcoidales bacterium]|nr:cell division protein FtsK [Dehalococcoidales bacterium]
MVLAPFRYWYVTLVAIIVVIIALQWQALVSWVNDVVTGTLRLLGWGLLFITIAIATLAILTSQKKLLSLFRHWNYWLGGIVFILVVWGMLAFFPGEGVLRRTSLGGNFGLGIIGDSNFIGALRLLGLVIIGIMLVAPRPSFRLIARAFAWLLRQLKLRVASPPTRRRKPSPPTAKPVETVAGKEAVSPATMPGLAQKDLKQVAQEVWKKYGEAPNLVTVDGWRLPPLDILDRSPEVQFSQADNVKRARLIEEALASYGVETKVVQINAGPTVTQFGVEPGWDRKTKEIREKDRDGNVRVRLEEVAKTRVKVERINSLSNDLALALAASSIRIESPVPGKSMVGIEVPNTVSGVVSMRGVIETSVYQKMQARSRLVIALGKGAGGEAVAGDLTKMPHLLIAGATGSGKTVCLDTVISSLLIYNTPYDVKFVMIDPKRVELTSFNSIPHLASPVIVDTDKALSALRWLNLEMDNRYQKLAAVSLRNIDGYNKNRQGKDKMPYLVLIVDELADLMMAGGDEVERILCRLAQLARAVGIHLVVATQRPSVDVVTGLIKANFPTRISFAVTSQVDSRTILDTGGAEKLLGRGDMLYMPTEAAKPKRLQGCFVSDAEIERLVYFWGSQRREELATLKMEELVPPATAGRKGGVPEDALLETARQLAREHPHISVSYLQRQLRIGYPRAARLMEELEEEKGEGERES